MLAYLINLKFGISLEGLIWQKIANTQTVICVSSFCVRFSTVRDIYGKR